MHHFFPLRWLRVLMQELSRLLLSCDSLLRFLRKFSFREGGTTTLAFELQWWCLFDFFWCEIDRLNFDRSLPVWKVY
jgi:hypothetical protein